MKNKIRPETSPARRLGAWRKTLTWLIQGVGLALIAACAAGGSPTENNDTDSGRYPAVSIAPDEIWLQPGETETVRVTTTRTGSGTNRIFILGTSVEALSVSPSRFDADLRTRTSVTQDIQVTAPAAPAPVGSYPLRIFDGSEILQAMTVNITNGVPGLAISADPSSVSVPGNTMSSFVRFRVRSLNGYEGPLTISWSSSGEATPSPATNNLSGYVTPRGDYIFSLKMYRYAAHTADIPIAFTVRGAAGTQPSSTTVTVRSIP